MYNVRMNDGDSLTEHLNAFNTVLSQLLSIYIKISDEELHQFIVFSTKSVG